MLTFIKFGGSVITDKTSKEAPDLPTIRQLAAEVRAARDRDRDLRLIIGHGSGSFGHTYAQRYGIHTGIVPGGDWMGFALTAAAALRLNRIVVDELLAAGVPALALQPSATLVSRDGALAEWDTTADPRADPRAERIPRIDSDNIAAVLRGAGGSHGVDVTGGMRGKVKLMWRLAESTPGLTVQLIGAAPGLLARALLGAASGEGTIIVAS